MPMNERHDAGYRLLFSQPRMVRDLCRGFLREEWTGWLDLDTVERREDPAAAPPLDPWKETAIWRLRWQGGSSWIYLLLSFQEEDDPAMALRVGWLRELLYQDLLRQPATSPPARLPVVLPVVLYHGAARWTAPRDALELFLPLPPVLQRHAPRTRYLLLDAARDPIPEGAGGDNLVSLLCKLERSRTPEAVDALLERVIALVSGPADEALRLAWSAYLGASFLPRRFPDLFTPERADVLGRGGVLA
jgi:putative YhgA-like transposase